MKQILKYLPFLLFNFNLAFAEDLKIISKSQIQPNEFIYKVQEGKSFRNQFTITKILPYNIVKKVPVLFLPGNQMSFDSFQVGSNSIVSDLKNNGHIVYGYSPRNKNVTISNYKKFARFAKNWGYKTYVKDALFIAHLIQQETKMKPIIIGFSLGVLTGSGAINKSPHLFNGFIALDGLFKSTNPEVTEPMSKLCKENRKLLLTKRFNLSQGILYKAAAKLLSIPIKPSRNIIIKNFTSNVPGHIEGFKFLKGNGNQTRFNYSSINSVMALVRKFNISESQKILTDVACIFSGEVTIDYYGLSNFTGPVLSITAENGFSMNRTHESFSYFTRSKLTEFEIPNYGHADLLLSKDKSSTVNSKILNWIANNF